MSLAMILLLVALILAVLASFNVASSRVGLLPLSFAFYLGYILLGGGMIG